MYFIALPQSNFFKLAPSKMRANFMGNLRGDTHSFASTNLIMYLLVFLLKKKKTVYSNRAFKKFLRNPPTKNRLGLSRRKFHCGLRALIKIIPPLQRKL